MLIDKNQSLVCFIDIQEKFRAVILDMEAVINKSTRLLMGARNCGIPRLFTEQYPQGLGKTVPELDHHVDDNQLFEKHEFSCYQNAGWRTALEQAGRKQVILAGVESHICILQTAFDCIGAGFEVFVLSDAIGSRFESDYDEALHRMRQGGVRIITLEMAFFEWARSADDPNFRQLSAIVK